MNVAKVFEVSSKKTRLNLKQDEEKGNRNIIKTNICAEIKISGI